jgi:homoserine kinase
LLAAVVQQQGPEVELAAFFPKVLAAAAELEGHEDNVAASLYGGCVASAGRRVVPIPMPLEPAIVVWIPQSQTSTSSSRGALADTVSRADAVFNIGRTAVLVAALASGDIEALRDATEDRLHQDVRFRAAPQGNLARQAMLHAGAWAAWLSGSGPTVAAMCAPQDAERILHALPEGGRGQVLAIDRVGARLLPADRA